MGLFSNLSAAVQPIFRNSQMGKMTAGSYDAAKTAKGLMKDERTVLDDMAKSAKEAAEAGGGTFNYGDWAKADGKQYVDAFDKASQTYYTAVGEGTRTFGSRLGDYYKGTDKIGDGRAAAVASRAAVTGAAVVGLGTGARALNGGTMTHNNRGQRDIAGIPFI